MSQTESKHRRVNLKVVGLAVGVLVIGLVFLATTLGRGTTVGTVTGLEVVDHTRSADTNLVHVTLDDGTAVDYRNDTNQFAQKTNVDEIQAQLEVGQRYEFTVIGQEFMSLVGMEQNIVELTPLS